MTAQTSSHASASGTGLPLVVHVVYRLDVGGLEVLLAECLARLPVTRYRQAVICVAGYGEIARRITTPGWAGEGRPPVPVYSLDKPPGVGLTTHVRLYKLLRRLRPTIAHTYNLPAVEYGLTAAAAGVPLRVHAEHGRSHDDPQGLNPRHLALRRLVAPLTHAFVPVSRELQDWLADAVHVPSSKNRLIVNGVDTARFHPAAPDGKAASRFIIGTVSRVDPVKNHAGLLDAFMLMRAQLPPSERERVMLAIVGAGPLLPALRRRVEEAGLQRHVWLPGERHDVPDLLRRFSVFVLPSLAEGTPVCVLEAMASGLPVLATSVGGIPDLVTSGKNGLLVAPGDTGALAQAMLVYHNDAERRFAHGRAGRDQALQRHGIDAMVRAYDELYAGLCDRARLLQPRKTCAE